MPAFSENWAWFVRGYLISYSTYILSHSMADFLVRGLPEAHFLLVMAICLLVGLALAYDRYLLWAIIPAVTTTMILIYRELPELWLMIRESPLDIWDVVEQGWLGTVVEVPLTAAWPLVGLTAFLSALFLGLWARGRLNRWAPTVLGMTLLLSQWFFFHDAAREYTVLFLPAGIAMAATAGTLPIIRIRGAIYAVGLTSIMLAISGIFPQPPGIWDWGKVGDLARGVIPALSELRSEGDPDFSLPGAGWSERERELGGPVAPSDRTMLTVTIDGPFFPGVLYLRGTVSTIYNGRYWEEEGEREELPDPDQIPLEPFPGDTYTLSKHVRMANMTSSTLFGTWQVMKVETNRDLLVGPEGSLHFLEPRRQGESYRVISQVPMIDENRLREEVAEAGFRIPARYRRYLQLPEDVPDRVHDLAQDIIADIDHPYDQALALESYLREFPYNLDVPAPPPDQEFVDFFLFDAQEGYCTYFSSALAVMLRSVGIPARWVQGFRLQIPLDDPDDHLDGPIHTGGVSLIAQGNDAHAWVEAYFSGYGWVLMEPTSGFEIPIRRHQPIAQDPFPEDHDREAPSSGADYRLISLQVLLALVLISFFATAAVVLRKAYQPRGQYSSSRDVVLSSYHQASRLLERSGSTRGQHLTPKEYLEAVKARKSYHPFRELTLLYEPAAYSRQSPGAEQADHAQSLLEEITTLVKLEQGLLRYTWARLG